MRSTTIDEKEVANLRSKIGDLDGGEYGVPFTDGIIDLEAYQAAKYRILWVLKEAVGEYSEKEYNLALINRISKERQVSSTLRNIGRISYAILNGITAYDRVPGIYDGSAESLRQIAVINVKKSMGSEQSLDSRAIVEAFSKNRDVVFQQIRAYRPDIVIMGYPEACKTIVEQIVAHFETPSREWEHIGECAYRVGKDCLYLWVYHPGFSRGKKYYDGILSTIDKCREQLTGIVGGVP